MSITLQTAVGTNVVFDLVKSSGDGQVFQNVGTSFQDTKVLTVNVRIGKTNTSKARTGFKYTYNYIDSEGKTKTDAAYFHVEGTIPETMPFAEADKAAYMVGTLAVHAVFKDAATRRKLSQS